MTDEAKKSPPVWGILKSSLEQDQAGLRVGAGVGGTGGVLPKDGALIIELANLLAEARAEQTTAGVAPVNDPNWQRAVDDILQQVRKMFPDSLQAVR